MTQVLSTLDALELNMLDTDASTLKFVDDADYEFVGGGNAVNGY